MLWIFIIFLPLLLIRGLRWVGIAQQKEYRWDRWWVYVKSPEGWQDFLTLIPRRRWLSITGLKRPILTFRSLFLSLSTVIFLGLEFWLLINEMSWIGALLVLLLTYVLLPLLIMISGLPAVWVAIVITYLYLWRAKQKLNAGRPLIIGITGSYGKTSTKLLVAHLLAAKFPVFVTPKSHNTRFSVAKSIVNGYQNQTVAVIEYAAYTKGEIKTLAQWFPPHLAVITGLSPQHLELFGSVEAIVQAKAELIKALAANSPVFCNAADPGAVKICRAAQTSRFLAYTGPQSVVELKHVGLTNQGKLIFVWRGHTIATNLAGLHYQANVAAAIALAEHLGVDELSIVKALTTYQPTAAFTQIMTGKNQTVIIDDGGTSNPTGFISALQLIKVWHKQKYTTVLVTAGIVDLGAKSAEIHQQLADQSRPIIDQVWYLGKPGLAEFKMRFGQQLIEGQTSIRKQIANIGPETAILIEGKIPKWLDLEIKNKIKN